jgi:hypothetical protein
LDSRGLTLLRSIPNNVSIVEPYNMKCRSKELLIASDAALLDQFLFVGLFREASGPVRHELPRTVSAWDITNYWAAFGVGIWSNLLKKVYHVASRKRDHSLMG